MEARIHPLDPQTRSYLRSSQIITSLPQLISELVQNSLDAGASQVEVGVNASEWECWVRDNGSGISRSGLELLSQGSHNGRYGSSKAYEMASLDNISTFGFRGEALASVADICCLEISSRTKQAKEAWSLILKGGNRLHYGPAIRWRLERPGTVVCVRDAFYNLPVRRKTHSPHTKTLDQTKKDLQIIALVFPHVAFSLEDTTPQYNASKVKLLSISRSPSILEAFRGAFGRGLVEHVNVIREESSDIRIDGFISLDGATSRAYQFLYINRHIVDPCNLHHIIDSQFSMSSFGKHAFDEDGETTSRPATRRSPRKNEKQSVYVLNISLPPSKVDSLLEPSKNSMHIADSDTLHALLSSTIRHFLERNNFLKGVQSQSPAIKRKELYDSSEEIETALPKITLLSPIKPTGKGRSHPKGKDVLLETPYSSILRRHKIAAASEDLQQPQKTPASRQNQRASKGISAKSGSTMEKEHSGDIEHAVPKASNVNERPAWIEVALKDWINPVFGVGGQLQRPQANQKQNVTFTADDLRKARLIGQADGKFIACVLRDGPDDDPVLILIDQHAADERVRVERLLEEYCESALARDVTSINDSESESDSVTHLGIPVKILLTKEEVLLLRRAEVVIEFARWGIGFEDHASQEVEEAANDDMIQVSVNAIPTVLRDKLWNQEEIRDVVKETLGQVMEAGLPLWPKSEGAKSDANVGWIKAMKNCPQSLLALINSKACRGAIMFNDTLSADQCSRLVSQLAETVFPFQCAHGRPSIAPLLSIAEFNGLRYPKFSSKNKRASHKPLNWKSFGSKNSQETRPTQA